MHNLDKNQRIFAITIIILYLVTRVLPAIYLPLIQDEALYSMMIEEQVHHPTLIPTFLGEAVSWKPSLFFWIYGALTRIQIINLEFTYRLPSIIFGLISLLPLYLFLKKIEKSENIVLLTIFIFVLSLPSIYSNSTVLLDTLNFLAIITSMYVYSEEKIGQKRFLIGGLLTFISFFLKHIIAITIPALIIPYFYFYDKKILTNKIFLISLIFLPLAFLLNHIMLDSVGLSSQLYSAITTHVGDSGTSLSTGVETFIMSFYYIVVGFGLWFGLSLVGLVKEWRSKKFMAIWFIPAILCTISAGSMPWYFLPFMPAVSYFAAACLLRPTGKEIADIFPILFTVIIAIFILVSMYFFYGYIREMYQPQKNAGVFLIEKSNVLVIGEYNPGIIAYSTLDELRNSSLENDFGWVLFGSKNISENSEIFNKFKDNYSANASNLYEGFGSMFSGPGIFRKPTNISRFDYITIIGNYSTNNQLIYNVSDQIKIYEVAK